MEIVRTILTVIYFIIALVVIILALIQTKDDAGLSQTITGSSTNNFYEKNKGRTKEGKQNSTRNQKLGKRPKSYNGGIYIFKWFKNKILES